MVEILRNTGTGGADPDDNSGTPPVELPIGSFTFKGKTRTNIEWRDAWGTFTKETKEQIRQSLISSGYFESTLNLNSTQRAWSVIADWAATEADGNPKWNLGSNLSRMGAAVGQSENAYITFGTVLTKPKDITGAVQTEKQAYTELMRFAYDNGIVLSEGLAKSLAKQLYGPKGSEKNLPFIRGGEKVLAGLAQDIGFNEGTGAVTLDSVKQGLRNKYVLPKYQGFADEIKAGFDVRDIANDYIQMVANALEIDPETIDLNDKLLQMALKPAKKAGGTFEYISYGDFQNEVRKDKRWEFTNNAKESLSATAAGIQRMFGL
jgi:hypothetical protein